MTNTYYSAFTQARPKETHVNIRTEIRPVLVINSNPPNCAANAHVTALWVDACLQRLYPSADGEHLPPAVHLVTRER
eukprot:COSAG01_NODE_1166_length_11442_cov_6.607511_12_plen_77_part_00